MRIKTLLIAFLTTLSINANSQNFDPWSGTVRIGGGVYGTVYSYVMPVTVGLLQAFKVTNFDVNQWSNEQHTFLRFFNIGGDILVPNWSMQASNTRLELLRPLEDYQTNFLNHSYRQFTNYVGYYFNWKDPFSRFGLWFGADYEWRSFLVHYPYPNTSCNKIQAIVPSVGVRLRLLDPMKEIGGFPFNVVIEGGVSFAINTKYENDEGYGLDALNNGFRPVLGLAVTTNRFGSIHVRWTKDLYQLFDKNYKPISGFLYNNEITNSFSCFSIGWALFI